MAMLQDQHQPQELTILRSWKLCGLIIVKFLQALIPTTPHKKKEAKKKTKKTNRVYEGNTQENEIADI